MQAALSEWITLSGNVAGVMIVIYWIVDTIRNWGGSPELKILKGELERTNTHIKRLIEALLTQRG
jgi:hypothetical protein